MGYKSGWLAVSATVPRLDLLKHPEGGPRAAANALKMLLPGWRLTGRTVGMMLGRGPERRIFLGTWGSTIVLGGDGSVLNDLALRFSSKKHRPDGLGVWSMWASTVVNSVEFFVRAPGWDRYVCTEYNDYFGADEGDSGDDMSLDYSGTPLPFESRLWDEERYPPPRDLRLRRSSLQRRGFRLLRRPMGPRAHQSHGGRRMGREGSDRGAGPGLRRPRHARGGPRSYSASYSTTVVTVVAAPTSGSARRGRDGPEHDAQVVRGGGGPLGCGRMVRVGGARPRGRGGGRSQRAGRCSRRSSRPDGSRGRS